ncbi:IS110 family RNA-guided transposase [Burkholderia sola]|uniref:IS110 family transposase n=1 Tax=Burkholderia sola TaxID=2843302 RepID=UPI0023DDBAFE|nr:IS110 family transposase [Burkholderia sola]MDF3086301.1 IS110 family transposase [Burkholderia sola]
MHDVTLVGIDLGKHSFHLHGQDRHGKAVFRKKVNRKQLIEFFAKFHPCTVVMEACAGAHYMARQLAGWGHQVKLILPQFVRPFVKSNKNDFVDAEAICEAASRPSMRFVTPKTESQQILSALHRVRDSLVRDRVKTANQLHGFLLEFGISLPVGQAVIKRLPAVLAEHALPPRLVAILERLHGHFKYLSEQISEIDAEMARQLADDELGQCLLKSRRACRGSDAASLRARRSRRGRGGSSVRRAAAGRSGTSAPARGSGACASRRRSSRRIRAFARA